MMDSAGWIEIDQGAIEHNLRLLRSELGRDRDFCAVLKADAYGHGIDLVLPVVMALGITAIGVASNREAEDARALGFSGRILRVRPGLPGEIEAGRGAGIEEWVGGYSHARIVAAVAAAGGEAIACHLSVNSTGLSRDGLELADGRGAAELAALLNLPGLDIRGICAHFATEDADDIRRGAARFDAETQAVLRQLGPQRAPGVQRHCATSYAALTVPESRFDLVRIGAAMYGESAANEPRLRRAMSLKSRVAAVNGYPAGNTVGYDRGHLLTHGAVLASVPIGYADGYHRSMGGRAHALVRGKRVPVIDRLAMNALTLDVTAVPGVCPGDEVVLYGQQGAGVIRADDLALANGALAADLYSAWGQRLPRVAVGYSPLLSGDGEIS